MEEDWTRATCSRSLVAGKWPGAQLCPLNLTILECMCRQLTGQRAWPGWREQMHYGVKLGVQADGRLVVVTLWSDMVKACGVRMVLSHMCSVWLPTDQVC